MCNHVRIIYGRDCYRRFTAVVSTFLILVFDPRPNILTTVRVEYLEILGVF